MQYREQGDGGREGCTPRFAVVERFCVSVLKLRWRRNVLEYDSMPQRTRPVNIPQHATRIFIFLRFKTLPAQGRLVANGKRNFAWYLVKRPLFCCLCMPFPPPKCFVSDVLSFLSSTSSSYFCRKAQGDERRFPMPAPRNRSLSRSCCNLGLVSQQ